MDCIIRKMNKNDVKEVFDMMKTFYATDAVINKPNDSALRTNIEYCLKDDDLLTCYVIVTDGKIAGYSILSKCYSTEYGGVSMWVEDIYVKPEYRKLGFGNKLMKFINEKYKDKAVRYELEVEENNIFAMKLYEKNGFHKSKYIVMTKET